MNRKERRSTKSQGSQINHPLDSVFQEAMRLQEAGRFDEAQIRYREILNFDPEHAPSLHMMGMIAHELGRNDIAEELIRRSISLNPKDFSSHNSLGNVLKKLGRYEDAITSYKKAVNLSPDFVFAYNNIGITFLLLKRTEDAFKYFRKAEALNPNLADTLNNIGLALQLQNKTDESTAYFKRAIEIKPDFLEALNNIGNNYRSQDKYYEAIPYYRQALALNPNVPGSLVGLGILLRICGFMDEAISCFKRAIDLEPTPDRYAHLLMAMIYASFVSPQELAAMSRKYGQTFADPLLRQRPLVRNLTHDRKLRIGYVSPDFNNHAVSYFFEPLLKLHDRKNFEIFGYYNNTRDDPITKRLSQEFDHWHNIWGMTDDDAADLIESDNIDILVDLAGHTAHNRLLVFARKPAPVQVTWLGYPATTGIKAIDYRITDFYAEPVGMTESLNVETLWRLPGIFSCYQPHANSPAVIDHPPFEDNGYITFGCFNNFFKVTDPVLETWAKIMAQIPDARLLLEIANLDKPEFLADTKERLQRLGLPMDRVILELRKPENQFVLYNKIDIALDPFPCVGGTTSLDTLWMGAPLITLAGDHFTSRMGVSILTNAGLPELIAENKDQYIKLSVDLASNKDRLRATRHNLRHKIAARPLMDQVGFTKNMESAYREMWIKYCAAHGDKQ